jgi:hypothetical protein
MTQKPLLILVAALTLGLAGAAIQAQPAGDPNQAWINGAIDSVEAEGFVLQGIPIGVVEETVFKGIDPAGVPVDLTFGDLLPGQVVHVHAILLQGTAVATHVFRGTLFHIYGVVTDLTTDAEGNPQTVEVNDLIWIHVEGARVRGRRDLNGDGEFGSMLEEDGNPDLRDLLQPGTTIAAGGIADGGIFAAYFVHVLVGDFHIVAKVEELLTDDSGNLTGFVIQRRDQFIEILVNEDTVFLGRGNRPMNPADLAAGMKVKVDALITEDETILALVVKTKTR